MKRDEGSVCYKQLLSKNKGGKCVQGGQIGRLQPSRTLDHQDTDRIKPRYSLQSVFLVSNTYWRVERPSTVLLCRTASCHNLSLYVIILPSQNEPYLPQQNELCPACHSYHPTSGKMTHLLVIFSTTYFFILWVSLTGNLGSSKVTVENLGWLSFCCSSSSAASLNVSEVFSPYCCKTSNLKSILKIVLTLFFLLLGHSYFLVWCSAALRGQHLIWPLESKTECMIL